MPGPEMLAGPLDETEALRQQLLQAQRLSSVGALASSVAHEFNNILTTIINYAKLGLQGGRRPGPEAGVREDPQGRPAGRHHRQRHARASPATSPAAARTSDLVRLVEEVLLLTEKDLSKHRVQVDRRYHARPVVPVVAGADRADPDQPGHQRPAGDADAAAGCGWTSARTRRPGWPRCGIADTGVRHPAGPAAADLRAVLHDQGPGRARPRRDRPGAERLPADHRAAPGADPRRERGRQGVHVYRQAAGPRR